MNCPKCKSEAAYAQGKVIICPKCGTITPISKTRQELHNEEAQKRLSAYLESIGSKPAIRKLT